MGANSSYKAMHDICGADKRRNNTYSWWFHNVRHSRCCTVGTKPLGTRNGLLYRFAKGIYYRPLYDKWDGTLREPSLDAIALKIAQRDNARIIPNGAYALNKLGLSTQVPANIIYITDGSARQVKFERKEYHFSAQ